MLQESHFWQDVLESLNEDVHNSTRHLFISPLNHFDSIGCSGGSLAFHYLRWCMMPPFMRQCWNLLLSLT